MKSSIRNTRIIVLSAAFVAAALAAPAVFADPAMQPMQPSSPASVPSNPQAPAGSTQRVNGVTLDSSAHGSGPDTSRFNIVSKQEAARQQGRTPASGGNSMTSDGTGAHDATSGG